MELPSLPTERCGPLGRLTPYSQRTQILGTPSFLLVSQA